MKSKISKLNAMINSRNKIREKEKIFTQQIKQLRKEISEEHKIPMGESPIMRQVQDLQKKLRILKIAISKTLTSEGYSKRKISRILNISYNSLLSAEANFNWDVKRKEYKLLQKEQEESEKEIAAEKQLIEQKNRPGG